MSMFCFQCQETARNQGCTVKGVCGKEPQTAALMDLLLYVSRGVAIVQKSLREKGLAADLPDHFLMDALFCTITNANFDDTAISERIDKAFALKKELLQKARENGVAIPDMPEVNIEVAPDGYQAKAAEVGVLSESNEDARSLKQLTIYGLKGMAAYADHALNLGFEDEEVYRFMEEALYQVSRNDIPVDELISLVLKTGETGVKAMALLDKANTTAYGNPEMTKSISGLEKIRVSLSAGTTLKTWKNCWNRQQVREWMSIPTEKCYRPIITRNSRSMIIS